MAREVRLHAHPDLSTIQLFLAYIACSLGGTALSSFLIGQPPGWLAVDSVCICYVVSFVLMRYEPFASFFLHIFRLPLLLPWLILMQDVGFSHSLSSFGIDRCLLSPSSLYAVATPRHSMPSASFPYFHPPTHLSFFSAIAVGWLSGTGGGLLRFGLSLLDRQWRFRFPTEVLDPPSVHVRLALWCGLLYYGLCNPHGWLAVTVLSRADAKLVVMAVVVSQVSGKRLMRWLADDGGKQAMAGTVKGMDSNGAAVAGSVSKPVEGSRRAETNVEEQQQQQSRQPAVQAADDETEDGTLDEQNGTHQRTRRRSTRSKRQ